MVETGTIVNADGKPKGVAADLGTGPLGLEYWAIASGTVAASSAPKLMANVFVSGTTTLQVSESIKAYGEISSGTFLPVGLSVTATTPIVATVEVLPGAKIAYDSVKNEVTSNKAYLNFITRIKLSDAEVRKTVAEAETRLTKAKKLRTAVSAAVFRARVTQAVRM